MQTPRQLSQWETDIMNDIKTMAWMAVFFLAGVWGCSRNPGASAAQLDRLKVLEAKCSKLEEDHLAIAEARDAAKQRLSSAEAEISSLKNMVSVLQEVRKERDLLNTRMEKLKKGLEELMSTDTALAESARAATAKEKPAKPTTPGIPASGSAGKILDQ